MGRLAFEVQLSTTFLDVVVARRTFYRAEGGLLVWVMGRFDPDYRRLTTDDLLFNNNSNILIVDEETAALSEGTGQFHVHCHFGRPVRAGDKLADEWDSAIIAFDTLTCEHDRQRCWRFDYEGEAAKLRVMIGSERAVQEAAAADALRSVRLLDCQRAEHEAGCGHARGVGRSAPRLRRMQHRTAASAR